MSSMTFLPKKKEISLNSMFIIEGYGFSQKTINNLQNREVYLEDKNKEKIILNLIEVLIGNMLLTQAIFKPTTKLKSNTIYYLKYTDQTKEESNEMRKWNSKTSKREKVFWKTTNLENIDLLNKDLKIEFNSTEVVLYGCGPSVNAIFDIKNKKHREIWYKTELINLVTKSKKTYIIREWKNNLNVGHGMCAGAFKFEKKGRYKVRFTPMNIDGKMNRSTEWFIFDNPHSKKPKGF
jgi:hypothetical protein